MTWIAACSGQRGTYQETIMVDENDLQYLRNINTKPGPNAGRSIDPTKPGPDSIMHELGECPPDLRYRDKEEKFPDGTAIRRLDVRFQQQIDSLTDAIDRLQRQVDQLQGRSAQSDAEPELVEKVAKAICQVKHDCAPETPMPIAEKDARGPPLWTSYIRQAKAATAILAQSDAVDRLQRRVDQLQRRGE